MANLILNKMTGTFRVVQPQERLLPLDCHVVVGKESLLPISLLIKPSNKMEGIFDIIARPTIKKQLVPVRDAYVTEEVPTFNYGKQSQMLVGIDPNGNRLRSFLYYDLTQLDKNLEIISAKLKLKVASSGYTIDMFELSTLNKKFDEYGVTYANQPVRERFLSIVEILRGLSEVEIDVTDIVLQWYLDSRTNNGFVIKEFEGIAGRFISFYTKESGMPPILEIEYFDPTFGIPGRSLLDIDFSVKQHYSHSIPIDFEVYTHYKYEELPIDLFIKAINGTLFLEFDVSKVVLPLEAHITKKLDDSIPIEFVVSKELADDLGIDFTISRTNIEVDFHVIKKLSESIPIEFTVSRTNVPVELVVSKPTIPIELQVRSFDSIPIEFSITQISVPIEFEVGFANYLPIVGIIYAKKESLLPIDFTVNKEQIPIEFNIVHANYLPLELTVRQHNKIDIDATIAKKLEEKIPVDLKVRAISELPIEFDVSSKFLAIEARIAHKKQTFKLIDFNVRGISDIPIEAEIRLKRDIPIFMEVRKVWFSDLPIDFYIDSPIKKKRKCYVMII